MRVNTLFPSQTEEEGIKGGIVLLKLKRISDDTHLQLSVTYEGREGNIETAAEEIEFGYLEPEYFANTGIRKAVVLSRYGNLMKNWIIDERESLFTSSPVEPSITFETGIIIPCFPLLGEWERTSVALQVSETYKQLFSEFKDYLQEEIVALGDESLNQEVTILEKLITYGN